MPIHNQACLALLERLRWGKQPNCPYCNSTRAAALPKEQRYHCNTCFTSYSVTVGTIFHGTRIDLAKWYRAIDLLQNRTSESVSVRSLARTLQVNKNTAAYIKKRIQQADVAGTALIQKLAKELKTSKLLENLEE